MTTEMTPTPFRRGALIEEINARHPEWEKTLADAPPTAEETACGRTLRKGRWPGRAHEWFWLCAGCREWIAERDESGRYAPGEARSEEEIARLHFCERCSRAGVWRKTALGLHVPPLYALARLEQVETKPPAASAHLKGWPARDPMLLIFGPPGSGKTFAAWALVIAGAARNEDVTYVDSTALHERWRVAVFANRYSPTDELHGVKLLVVDEFGEPARAMPSWPDAMRRLLEARLAMKRPTVVCTPFGSAQLAQLLGEPVVSRLLAFCPVNLRDVDRRKRAGLPAEEPENRV